MMNSDVSRPLTRRVFPSEGFILALHSKHVVHQRDIGQIKRPILQALIAAHPAHRRQQ
ncbi:hypothetical protein D9M73_256790 [compost metagenome]